MKATPVLAASPSALEVMIRTDTSDSSIDEVGFDLGPDERGTGILDDWTGHTDESSAEQTGTLSLSDVAEQRRLALLSRLGMDPKIRTVPAHIQALDGPPLPGIRERIQLEYLDPLPSPGTIDAPQNPVHGETQEVEVTHSRPGSLLPASHQDDETAARFEPTDSFGSTSEVTRIRPRPVPEQAPEPRRFGSLIWLTLTGWLLALGALFMIWYRSGGGR
jgi:hypothetical protein